MAILRIPVNDLPPPSIYNSTYELRFRIVSENRNRVSAWTPIFNVDPQLTYTPDGDLSLQYTDAGAVSASWDSVSIIKNGTAIDTVDSFDVWIKWAGTAGANPGNWLYQGRISSKSLGVTIPTLYSYGVSSTATPYHFYIEVYRPSKEKTQNTASPFLMYSGDIDITTPAISQAVTQSEIDLTAAIVAGDETNFAMAAVL